MSKIEVNEIDVQSGSTITVGSACKSVAVPGNVVKSNALQASDGGNIVNQSGTTITLGASGDTVTLASGASQTGFGRTGTVDWQTGSIKTSDFTAVANQGFFVDTNGGAVEATLPAGSAGAIISFQDYRNTFDTNNLTVSPNGSEKINTGAGSIILSTEGEGITLVYIDSTVGWRSIQDNVFADVGSNFISATGGTVTCSGNCRIHTFTGPGTFTVSSLAISSPANTVGYLVVAGGGAGGSECAAGGGGAGGFREGRTCSVTPYTASPLVAAGHTVSVQAYPITVGAGGTGAVYGTSIGTNGANSVFSSFTSTGGGRGAMSTPCGVITTGQPGGSGGAGSHGQPGKGDGNTPPVSPPQGNDGGARQTSVGATTDDTGGGGGGAIEVGNTDGTGDGGDGATTHITGSPVTYAGGGGGAARNSSNNHPNVPAPGGSGGGGKGGGDSSGYPRPISAAEGGDGTANTGGGGGGGAQSGGGSPSRADGGNGGSGVVIIRYKVA